MYVPVAKTTDIPSGSALACVAGRYEIALFHIDGEFHALENVCPHQGGPLADGYIEAGTITCPWHAWCFEIRSGKMTLGEYARVPRFDVRIEGTTVLVRNEPDNE